MHDGKKRFQSSLLIQRLPLMLSRSMTAPFMSAMFTNTSHRANSPIATTRNSRPSISSGLLNTYRGTPLWLSMPIVAIARPNSVANNAFTRERPARLVTTVSPANIREKNSGGPNFSAIPATQGPNSISISVAKVPAMNEPIAAAASA